MCPLVAVEQYRSASEPNITQNQCLINFCLMPVMCAQLLIKQTNSIYWLLQIITALILVWSLITLAVIDFNTSLLPDSLTLPLLWLGLIANSFELFCSLQDSLYGAIFGYVSLWSVFQAFKFMTNKDGMGYGDFKLLAALGAWLGWSFIIPIIFISSIVGSIVGISLITSRRLASNAAIPFGPYLVLGGLICLLLRNHVKSLFNIL